MIMNKHIFLASQKDDNTDLPTPEDFYHIGTIGKIKQMLKLREIPSEYWLKEYAEER